MKPQIGDGKECHQCKNKNVRISLSVIVGLVENNEDLAKRSCSFLWCSTEMSDR